MLREKKTSKNIFKNSVIYIIEFSTETRIKNSLCHKYFKLK